MDARIELNPNEVVAFLGKLPQEFTRADMIEFICKKGIRMVDFMYPAEDGRVKTLNFTVNNLAYVETILTEGERVDGSSLFPSFIEAGNSTGPRSWTLSMRFRRCASCAASSRRTASRSTAPRT